MLTKLKRLFLVPLLLLCGATYASAQTPGQVTPIHTRSSDPTVCVAGSGIYGNTSGSPATLKFCTAANVFKSLLPAGTISGTGVTLCTDANGFATTVGCTTSASSAGSQYDIQTANASGGFSAVATHSALTGQVVTANNGAAPTADSPGVVDGNGAAHVTTTPYPVACDSATAIADRGTTIVFDSGSSVVNMSAHTTSGCGGGMVFSLINESGSTITVNRGGSDTINVTDGATKSVAATSFTIPDGGSASLNNGEGAIWNARVSDGKTNCAGLPALTGDVTSSAGACATTSLPSAVVDTTTPVTVSTTRSAEYHFNENATAATAVTYDLPTAAAGKQVCVANAYNGSAPDTGTLELLTSASGQFIIYTDGTLSLTGGNVTSTGAAGDAACVVGVDATHWKLYVQSGTWTKN